MKYQFLLTIFAVALVGCGKEKRIQQATHDPAFESEVMEFESLAAEMGVAVKLDDVNIVFGAANSATSTLAVCITPSNDDEDAEEIKLPTIEVNPAKWATLNAEQRKALIAHEAGHCSDRINSGHNSELSSQGIPMSIMYPYLVSGSVYSAYKRYYVGRLVNGNYAAETSPEVGGVPSGS